MALGLVRFQFHIVYQDGYSYINLKLFAVLDIKKYHSYSITMDLLPVGDTVDGRNPAAAKQLRAERYPFFH